MRTLATLFLTLLFCLSVAASFAAFPQLMNFQGRLDDTGGNPVPDGDHMVTFRLFDVPSGGAFLWEETQTVATVGGVFSVILGGTVGIPESIFNLDSAYLEIQPQGSDPTVPRSRLSSVPYAWRAKKSDDKTIDASELIIGTLSEGRLPQGAIDSTEIAVESIAANRIADEPGLAHSFAQQVVLSSSIQVLDSVAVTLPKGGWLVLMGNGTFIRDHVSGSGNCAASVSLSNSRTAHSDSSSAKFSVISTQPTGTYAGNFMMSRVVAVNAGTSKWFLVGDASSAIPVPRVENVHLNAIYLPTAYGNIESAPQ